MAKHISEIFESNPELLQTKEVKELAEQFKIQFSALKKSKYDYWDKVTEIIMHSDMYVIGGYSSDEAIKKIMKISF